MLVFRLTDCHMRRIKRFRNGVHYIVSMIQTDQSDCMWFEGPALP